MDATETTVNPGGKLPEPAAPETAVLDGGGYEVLRARLEEQGRELASRTEALNQKRRQIFGSTELTVGASERVRTENACVPRDLIHISGHLLVGFNVFFGLKTEKDVGDVFSLHRMVSGEGGYDLSAVPLDTLPGFLTDPRFVKDFNELYRFYKNARLMQLTRSEGRLFFTFQTGSSTRDVRVFRFAVDGSERVTYIDSRGETDLTPLRSHDFDWTSTSREDQVAGRHPHVSIQNEVFVETVGGDLTIKIENNTEDGLGIYRESVEDRNQALDDARILYARLGGLLVLRILPFREERWRHLVYNSRTKEVFRIDAVGLACLQLPEGHGIIFPGGYCLNTGEHKVFDGEMSGFEWHRVIRSPNGEDMLYAVQDREAGRFVLYPYNLIRKEVQSPIACSGFTLMDDGTMVVLRSGTGEEPERVHPLQIWKTPFISAEHEARAPSGDGSYLAKVGNAELVRGISDLGTIGRLIRAEKPGRRIFEDIVTTATRALDTYYWLGHEEAGGLGPVAEAVRRAAELILGEYDKVQAVRRQAEEALARATSEQRRLVDNLRPQDFADVDAYLRGLTELRAQRGRLITLRELRYMDLERVSSLEAEATAAFATLSTATVEFLLAPRALEPVAHTLEALIAKVPSLKKSLDGEPLKQELGRLADGLNLLAEVAGGLEVADATARAAILEHIAQALAQQNRVRAVLEGKLKDLKLEENRLEFSAQFRLLGQSVQGALSAAATPEQCDEQLGRLMVQLEDLEGRFGEIEAFSADLTARREEVYEAFAARKQVLLEERQRRADALVTAAQRIIAGVIRRAAGFTTEAELQSYFAADSLVEKLRSTAARLRELKDLVRADELEGRLKALRQDALRGLRDRRDLQSVEDGTTYIRLGRHRFGVNTQPLELTLVPREGGLAVHLTGTDFYLPIRDPALDELKDLWDRPLPSETAEIYRSEYLAASLLLDAEDGGGPGPSLSELRKAAKTGELQALVRRAAQQRYDEGYEPGVHDADAAAILGQLLQQKEDRGLLAFSSGARALALLFWSSRSTDDPDRGVLGRLAQSIGRLHERLGPHHARAELGSDLARRLARFAEEQGLPADLRDKADLAGRYLALELGSEHPRFVVSEEGHALCEALIGQLDLAGQRHALEEDLRALVGRPGPRYGLLFAWLQAFLNSDRCPDALRGTEAALPEAAVLLMGLLLGPSDPGHLDRQPVHGRGEVELSGLLGQHPRVQGGRMVLRLDEVLDRVDRFRRNEVPRYRRFRALALQIVERERARLRPSELRPRVLSTFVRNRLINEVYLPLIADNLAKQMGAAGENKRTDLQGLLLLISPPGYGKTTLVEYVASQLGLAFVKINGPALGHAITSLDPAEAQSAPARREVETINLALKMGQNVMLYLDDIQHTSPELLQKFISLCDAQRRIEGVWDGQSCTYDLRGKRFSVVMAGNPYTESGQLFRIPDMLANRADTYNLGDILSGQEELFALSFLENSLTSNPTLAPLASRDQADIHRLVRLARGEEVPPSEFTHGYTASELAEMATVMQKLTRVQGLLLKVNQAYIASAAREDAYRDEPPFKLQGSYRNMNKVAEKVVAVMNDEELERLLDDHYAGEAQTLTTGAEHNLLKLDEIRGRLQGERAARWQEIRRGFARIQAMGGKEEDPVARVVGQLVSLGQQVDGIRQELARSETTDKQAALVGELARQLAAIRETLAQAGTGDRQAALGADLVRQLAGIRESLDSSDLGERLAGLFAAVGKDLQGLRQVLGDAAPTEKLGALERQLAAIRLALREPASQSRVTAQLAALGQEMANLRQALTEGSSAARAEREQARSQSSQALTQLASMARSLDALPAALVEARPGSQGPAFSEMTQALAALPEALMHMRPTEAPGAVPYTSEQANRLAAELTLMGRELKAIRLALEQGRRDTERHRTLPVPSEETGTLPVELHARAAERPALAAGAMASDGSWLEPYFRRLEESLSWLARPQLEVTVRAESPPGIQELLAQQVAIVERTLIPLVRTATRHMQEGPLLDQHLRQLIELMQRVDERLRAGVPANLENIDAARRRD